MDDGGIFAGKSFFEELVQFWHAQVEHPGEQTQCEYVFALVAPAAADGFDRQSRNGHADVSVLGEVFREDFLHVIGIVQNDAAFFE